MQHDKRTYLLPQFLLSSVSKDGVGMDIETFQPSAHHGVLENENTNLSDFTLIN